MKNFIFSIITIIKRTPFYWYILLWSFFFISIKAFGNPIISKSSIFQATMLTILFLYIKNYQKLFLSLLIPYFIMSWLYLPQGFIYGKMSLGIIASLLETNITESWQYIFNFSWYIYLSWLGYLSLFLAIYFLNSREQRTENREQRTENREQRTENICFLLCLLLVIFYSIRTPILNYKKYGNFTEALNVSPFAPLQFLGGSIYAIDLYYREKKLLESELAKQPSWQLINSNQKYKNYILIIGESVRADYMSINNYPIDNSTFLKSTNGIYIANYIATAPNTQTSINRTLYQVMFKNNEEKILFRNNIISLAKLAGIQTYWLSNQGAIGSADTAAARLGKQADHTFFTKNFSFDSENHPDTALLPKLNEILSIPMTQSRLIVLHLMGSHAPFCSQVYEKLEFSVINSDLSCYLQTIKQTDNLISSINQSLQKTGEPYSVIYFSDHGLSSTPNKTSLTHGNQYKQNYHVPFIRFDSDSTERTIIHSPKSAFNFINGFAEWLGIEEKTLSQQPSFFEDKPNGKIRVFNWHEMVDFDSLEDDPPLPPTPYK